MPKIHDSIKQDRIDALSDRAETTLDSPGLCVACGANVDTASNPMHRNTSVTAAVNLPSSVSS